MIFRNKINKDDDYTVNLKDCLAKTEFIDGDTVTTESFLCLRRDVSP